MAAVVRGVILVGHGDIPKGCPQELVTKLKRLDGQRACRCRQRSMNRTQESASGRGRRRRTLEAVTAQLQASLREVLLALAYNEFLALTSEESVRS